MLDIRYFGEDSEAIRMPQTSLNPAIKKFLQEYPVGGIILFRENIENDEQVRILIDALQENTAIKRFIAIDEEGGVVSRIGVETIGNTALGALNKIDETKKTASLIAHKLATLGINFNFAPVIDVNSNPDNPIINVRAFASNPELVTQHAKAFIAGLHAFNIISCVKHFPGHGDTATDSHLGTTIVHKSLTELENCELYPYTQLIVEECLDAIMTAHIVVPALDANLITVGNNNIPIPATLSKEILTTLLRQKMGFEGVVITDAMDMQAISANFDPVVATITSIRAGSDIILMPVRIWDNEGIAKFKEYFAKVCDICAMNVELRERVTESFNRVRRLKTKFFDLKPLQIDEFPEEYLVQYQNTLAQKSCVLYKNAAQHLPFKLSNTSNILVIANQEELLEATLLEIVKISEQMVNSFCEVEGLCLNYAAIDEQSFSLKLKNISQVLVLTHNLTQQDKDINKLFITLNKSQIPYVMLSCRNPYDIKYAAAALTNILVYGVTGFDQTNYRVNPFLLNLRNSLIKLFNADPVESFNPARKV